jgi:hypothetical protein
MYGLSTDAQIQIIMCHTADVYQECNTYMGYADTSSFYTYFYVIEYHKLSKIYVKSPSSNHRLAFF